VIWQVSARALSRHRGFHVDAHRGGQPAHVAQNA